MISCTASAPNGREQHLALPNRIACCAGATGKADRRSGQARIVRRLGAARRVLVSAPCAATRGPSRRISMRHLIVAIAAIAASTAVAQPFVEWQLPAVMQPGDIGVDSVVGDPFFLDPPTSSINRLSAGTVTQWAAGPCAVT